MKYYSYINKVYGFGEVTKEEYIQLHGTTETKPYIGKLYRGEITEDEIPEGFREEVVSAVEKRNTQWGTYDTRPLSGAELMNMVTEVLNNDAE